MAIGREKIQAQWKHWRMYRSMTLLLWDNALANSKLNIASYTRYFDFVSMTFSSKGKSFWILTSWKPFSLY